ncbi:leptin receptor [Trichomycterus rosablanca]|uniref:leptin receptor n=1 Tax=Trichomycterus rosablanca TaxID=2290929 RepID=UPI002F35D8BF
MTLRFDRILYMMLLLILSLFVALHGASALVWSGVYQDAQWKAQMCCDLGSDGLGHPDEPSEPRNSSSVQCRVQNFTNSLETSSDQQSELLSENCLDIRCRLEDKQANVICYLKHHRATNLPTGGLTVSLWPVGREQDELNSSSVVQCTGDDDISCSVALRPSDASVSLFVGGLLNGVRLQSQEMHISVDQLRLPAPLFNLQYNVTTEGEVMITWNDSQTCRQPSCYQIRYSSNTSLEHWEVFEVQDPWVSLRDLGSGVRYTVQVRCRSLHHPDHWTDCSHPLYLALDVSYIPAELFTRPGEDVTVYCVLHNRSWTASRAVWMLNGQLIPDSHYRAINERVSAVTVRSKEPGFDTLMCCYPWGERYKCSIAYAKVYIEGLFEADISCQTDQHFKADSMTCKWNKSAWALVRFLYRRYTGLCEEMQREEEPSSEVEECPEGAGDYRQCTLRRLSLFSCYKLWLVVEGGHGKVRSLPVFLSPVNYVKPSPLSVLDAVSFPNKTLMVSWRRPYLPAYDLQYELRHVPVRGSADSQWKVFGPILEPQASVPVDGPCSQYKVAVRFRRLNGSGYWSDWSDARTSSVYSSKAPESGPDFWRVIQEDPARNQANVTLLFKIPAVDPDSCVQGLLVVHQTSGGSVWSDDAALGSSYTFQWGEEVHTVTVMSHNSVGFSARNRNMTLEHQPKRQCVRWFRAAANASCVSLSWTLTCEQSSLQSFVVEWLELSRDAGQGTSSARRTEWLRVPSTARDLHLYGHFYGTEEFKLYPVFVDGEGEPVRCTMRNDLAAYMLLMIIAFLSVVLFVTLIISQNQLKKLMWKDVPNPSNCSWAKGMDLNKMNGTESLFGHSEGLTSCPLLPVSENVCEVEIVDKLFILDEDREDKALLHRSFDKEGRSTNLTSKEGSLEPLSLDMSTVATTPETSGQSSVNYSTVLVFDQPVLLRKQQESLSSSSDEGNFSANNSEISGSFSGNLWELENPSCSDGANPRNSCSYNSGEEFSETSEHEDENSVVKELYYMGMNDEEDEDDEDFMEEAPDNQSHTDESDSEFSPESERKDLKASCTSQRTVSFYLPQFRTAADKPVVQKVNDSILQL